MKTCQKCLVILFVFFQFGLYGENLPPVIRKHPISQILLPGSTTRLTVKAEGTEPLHYKWYKDNVEIQNATNNVLFLKNIDYTATGTYIVVVSNAFGAVMSLPAAISISELALNDALDNLEVWKTGGDAAWFNESNMVARSGFLFPGEESWIETKVVGPAILSFRWKFESDPYSSVKFQVLQNVRSEVVYDNTVNYLYSSFQVNGNYEVGDQIILNTNGLLYPIVINYFSLTYWGLNFSGNELMNVSFYLNDGPGGAPGGQIWDSGWFSIPQTPKSAVIFDEDIRIKLGTPSFTWAVKFSGIEQGESVGLWLYSPPAIGGNFTDYWIKGTNGWELRMMSGYSMDFEAKVGMEKYDIFHEETIGGVFDWETKTFSIPSGTNILRWTFIKGSNLPSGNDAAWLDDVRILQPSEPIILEFSKPQFGVVEGKGELFVNILGAEPLWFQWYKNGVPLVQSTGMYGINSPRLIFTNLNLEHAGNYTLLVSNMFGSVMSPVITLQVFDQSLKNRLSEGVDNNDLSFITGGDGIWDLNTVSSHDGIDCISPIPMPTNGVSWVEAIVTEGDGILSFWWKLDSWDARLKFFIDGFELYTLETPTDWVNEYALIDSSRPHKVRWVYEQISSQAITSAVAFVDQVIITYFPPMIIRHPEPVSAMFGSTVQFSVEAIGYRLTYQWLKDGTNLFDSQRICGTHSNVLVISNLNYDDAGYYSVIVSNPVGYIESYPAFLVVTMPASFGDAVEANQFTWVTGGDAPWIIVEDETYDGIDAAASGMIGDNQASWLSTTITGPGTLSFYAKVSSEEGYDYMEFLINNSSYLLLSGERNWQHYTFELPPGLNTVKWIYIKDPSYSFGQDRAWLDQVEFQPYTTPIIVNQPKNVKVEKGGTASFQVEVSGPLPIFYQWYKDGVCLVESLKFTGTTNSTLVIANVNFQDVGNYFLVASNAYGAVTSVWAKLNIYPLQAYGNNLFNQIDIPDGLTNICKISAGLNHSLALKCNGDVVAWGWNIHGQAESLIGSNVIDIAAGDLHNLALLADGTVIGWGDNSLGQINIPAGLSNVIAIAAGGFHSLALTREGKVIAWGDNSAGQTNVPRNLFGVVAIAAGYDHSVALLNNGKVVIWGGNITASQITPPQFTNILAVSAGRNSTVGLRTDKTLVGWGNIPSIIYSLSNVVSVDLGYNVGIALKSDGRVVTWSNQSDIPPVEVANAEYAISVSAGGSHYLILQNDEKPFITIQPRSTFTMSDKSVLIPSLACGAQPILYQWFFNGMEIPGGTNYYLNIESATLSESGEYYCLVSNEFGVNISDAMELVVQPPSAPIILVDPGDTNVLENTTLKLIVNVIGSPPLYFQWKKDGVSIAGANENELIIKNIQFHDTGLYSIVVSNEYGTSEGAVAFVNVLSSPKIIAHPTNIDATLNELVVFRVTAIGTEPLYYQWRRNGIILVGETNSELMLIIDNIDLQGTFDVIVSNHIGSALSRQAILTIGEPPFITNQPDIITKIAGEEAVFAVEVTGSPPLFYQWKYFGIDIPGETNSTLRIPHVTANDEGFYSVLIANKYGFVNSSDIMLTVLYPPLITQHPQSVSLKSGDALYLMVDAHGTEPLSYQWFKNDQPLLGEVNSFLNIPNVGIENSGNYWALVMNEVGFATSRVATVTIEEPPYFIWVRTSGGTSNAVINKIAEDKYGNIVCVGMFDESVVINGQLIQSRGGQDILILKYSKTGELLWYKQEGGPGDDYGNSVAISPNNEIYVVGSFTKKAFIGNIQINQSSGDGIQIGTDNQDIFVAKYSPSGDLVWVKTAGGTGNDEAKDVICDISGSIIVAGVFENVARFDNYYVSSVGLKDVFISKYNPDGECVWVAAGGGFGIDSSTCVVGDNAGNVYLSGTYTRGARFGNLTLKSEGEPDGFVAKYDSKGNIKWLKAVSGNGVEICSSITVDSKGENILVVGNFGSGTANNYTLSVGGLQLQSQTALDIFVLRLDSAGIPVNLFNALSQGLNPPTNILNLRIYPTCIKFDRSGDILLSGYASGEIDTSFIIQITTSGINLYSNFISDIRILSGLNSIDGGIVTAGSFKHQAYFGNIYAESIGESDGFVGKISKYSAGPPLIVNHPVDRITTIGGMVKFEVGAIGALPLYYQWFKDDNAIPEANDPFYEIGNVQSIHEGNYYVIVSNMIGCATSQVAQLKIAMPPIITNDLKDVVITVGNDFELIVEATGSEPLSYIWFFNNRFYALTDEPFIYLTDVNANNAGEYYVIITNEVGNATSRIARVTITESPNILIQPSSQETMTGLSAKFFVDARGTPPLYYQWYFNNLPLIGETNSVLRLFKITSQMDGEYFVVVSNSYGSVTSETARLTVNVLPAILIQPISQTAQLGDTVIFSVTPVDPVGVNYQWFKNEKIIPGATNSYLEINNVGLTNAGAYHVVLQNKIGAIRSATANLRVIIPDIPFSDNFESRGTLYTLSGYGRANNSNATRQPGEPLFGGRRLTNSVWITWFAPISGIATISLQGSSFDTVLAVFTGSVLTNLTLVALNDDAEIGENYSRIQFNAVAGTEYIIGVNGIGGGGEIVMQWNLESTSARVPELISDLMDTNVFEGASVTFTVMTTTGKGVINWYFNGSMIASNTPSLTIENVNRGKVGIYQAEIIEGNRVIYTRAVKLNIIFPTVGMDVGLPTMDKFSYLIEMVFSGEGSSILQHSSRRLIRTQGPARGFTGSQVFSTYGSTTDPGEPLHCGIAGGASEWFVYQAPTNGLLIIDTFGSTYDTVLAVYDVPGNVPPNDYTDLRSVACNNDVSPTNQQSRVVFNATAETIYYIAIDGVGGARGVAQLNYTLITPPGILSHPTNQTATIGQNVNFSVTASGTNLNYIWRFNSVNLSGKTNSVLTLFNVQTNHEGYYSVIISNEAGVVVSSNAYLTVNYAPIIISNPISRVVVKGGSTSLTGIASGSTPLRYQWFFNQSPLATQTNNTLTLSSVTQSASGEYWLIVSNSLGVSTSAPAFVTVVEANDQSLITSEDSPVLITLGPATTNGIVLGYIITTPPANGILSGVGNIRVYTPSTNYYGSDSFAFAVSDGTHTSSPAVVSLTITPINDPPVIIPVTNVIEYANSLVSFVVAANDVDGPSLTYSLGAGAPSGAVINPSTGLFTWTPSTNYIGTNLITFIVNDNGSPALTATQTIYVVVLPLNPVEILHSELLTNGFVRFKIQGRIGRRNVIESTVLFNKWTEEYSVVPVSEIFYWTTDPASQNRKFYRIKVEQ